MVSALSPNHLRDMQAVHARLQSGDDSGALAAFRALPQASQSHPSGVFLHALILQALGRFAEARSAFEHGLEVAPEHPGLWNGYGNLLDDLGDGPGAVDALKRAASLQPDSADTWINLGIAATSAGRIEVAEDALARGIRAAPGVPRGWSALGVLEEKKGRPAVASDLYRRALSIDPEEVRSRHNLAILLRKQDKTTEALELAEEGLRLGPVPPETATLRAHLLADAGRVDEAIAEYQNIIGQVPDQIDAHETLALLLPQVGRDSEALAMYRRALPARPQSAPLWASALRAATATGDHVQLVAWAQEAEAVLGPAPHVRIARATGLARIGNVAKAVDILRELAADHPGDAAVHQHLAHALMVSGDAKAAERRALDASRLDPDDQSSWALLSVIWRVLGDTREQWLADYETLVMPIDLPEDGAFFASLADRLTAWHMMREHPADQSLRGGTQTRGNLFDRNDPLIGRLADTVRTNVQDRLRSLPSDNRHPFLSRRRPRIDFSASWSVRLRSQGFHISHMHPKGWLSSALYVSLPPEVSDGNGQGALTFGVPDEALNLDLPPRRIVQPAVGRLVVFPSYLWHGTLPFESAGPRLTVAFDALPAG